MILHHLLLRENPPFSRAILQSGVVGVGGPVPVTYHDAAWKELQEHFNVTTVEEMRNVPAMELCQKLTDLGNEFYPPVSDGAICENPLKQYTAQGSYNTLDALIIGDMTDEGTLYSRVQPAAELYQEYEKRVPSELLDDFHALYPPQNLETPEKARAMLDSLASVILFQYPIDRTANAVAELNPNTRLYRYRFDFGLEVTQASGLGKHHGADILYTFLNRHLTDSELRIAKKLVTHWIMFAYDRNLEEELGWKRYDTQSRLCFVYGENGNELQNISKSQDLEKYQFWQLVEETKVRSSIV
jgi:carboxylesterase type B